MHGKFAGAANLQEATRKAMDFGRYSCRPKAMEAKCHQSCILLYRLNTVAVRRPSIALMRSNGEVHAEVGATGDSEHEAFSRISGVIRRMWRKR